MTSQKEDEQLIERVFEMKCINKSLFVCILISDFFLQEKENLYE